MDTLTVKKLRKLHIQERQPVQSRLSEFKGIFAKGDKEIFRELCFCILTANGTARSGINCINALGEILFTGTEKEIYHVLKGRCRWVNRAGYITRTREYLKSEFNFEISKKIKSFNNQQELRDYFANNKNIVGLGYKESSHFLRNIGFSGYAILDKHILNCLHELGALNSNNRPKSKASYLEMELRMKEFSKKVNISMDELDLLLWSYKTGEVLK